MTAIKPYRGVSIDQVWHNGYFTAPLGGRYLKADSLDGLYELIDQDLQESEPATAAQKIRARIDAKDAGALDNLVHDQANHMAAAINNDGVSSQIDFLNQRGLSDEDILEHL